MEGVEWSSMWSDFEGMIMHIILIVLQSSLPKHPSDVAFSYLFVLV